MRLHVWFALSLITATTSIISVFSFIPISARMLSGSWSERTSYSRVHTDGGFEETIEVAKTAWTWIKTNTALTFEDWLCISRALVIGQAAAMAIWPALSHRNQRMAQRE